MAKYRNWGIAVACFALLAFVVRGDFVITGGQLSSFGSGSASSSSLNTSLVSYWKIDETSGTRVDQIGGYNLTDNNTVGYTNGIIGNSGFFQPANSEYLSKSDEGALSGSDRDFTISAWVYLNAKSATYGVVSKFSSSNGNKEYRIFYSNSSDRFRFDVSYDGTNTTTVSANVFGSVSTGTWNLVVAYHDSVNNVIGISINGGIPDTAAHSTGVYDSTSSFNVGTAYSNGSYFNGLIDEVGFWDKVLTSGERTELYDSGAGKTCCPF